MDLSRRCESLERTTAVDRRPCYSSFIDSHQFSDVMPRVDKSVFISYRRSNFPWAVATFLELTHNGYDVFFDYMGVASGAFDRVIIENIRGRAHFLVLLTPSALERCADAKDWLRREIEAALDSKRNVVTLFLEGFDIDDPKIKGQLTGKLAVLPEYQGLKIVPEYFLEGMKKLRESYLNVTLDAVLHPTSVAAQSAATDLRNLVTQPRRRRAR